MLLAILQFTDNEMKISDRQSGQFSPVISADGYVIRKDKSGKTGRYYNVEDVQTGMAHKLTPFKMKFTYDE